MLEIRLDDLMDFLRAKLLGQHLDLRRGRVMDYSRDRYLVSQLVCKMVLVKGCGKDMRMVSKRETGTGYWMDVMMATQWESMMEQPMVCKMVAN